MRVQTCVILVLAICSAATNAAAQTTGPCLKPWAIPDKWIDNHDDPMDGRWTADDTFETADSHGNPLSDPDVYVGPSSSNYTGFTLAHDLGSKVTLKIGDPKEGMKPGWLYAIDLGGAGGGANDYRTAIATCSDTRVFFGESLRPLAGNLAGPTVQGVADLINLDPTATWDPPYGVIDSCASSTACGPVSPRIVFIAVFDPARFEVSLINGGQPDLVVTNFIPVFIDGVVGGKITGYITTITGVNHP